MPKDGFKSITVSDEVYNKLLKEYHLRSDELKEQGVCSFTGFITKSLNDHKEQSRSNDLTELLIINNSILFTMFDVMAGSDKDTAQDNILQMKMHMAKIIQSKQKEWQK